MRFNNLTLFDGKNIAKTIGNKLDSYDGSLLTNLKFMQLTDIGQPQGNKLLATNQDGTEIEYLNANYNIIKQIDITNEDTNNVIWDQNLCTVQHDMNGYIFIQLFDDTGYGVPIIPIYINNNTIAFHINEKPKDNEIYKLICFSSGYSLNNMNDLVEDFYNKKLLIENLNNTSFTPQNYKVYKYTISGDETFTFNSPSNINEIINFRLYLITPSTLVSYNLPTNIIWENLPDLTELNSLYMFSFEWNPILNKWLGNQMWNPVSLQVSSSSTQE